MLGLVLIVVAAIYLSLSVAVVTFATARARVKGRSPWRWGLFAAGVMYLIPFWDWLPTVLARHYYCSSEAGFFVVQSKQDWEKQNPGIMDGLERAKGESQFFVFNDGRGKTNIYPLNSRFEWKVTQEDISNTLPVIRVTQEIKDTKTGALLAKYVDFGTGNSVKNTIGPPGPLRFWLSTKHCPNGEENEGKMMSFFASVRGDEK